MDNRREDSIKKSKTGMTYTVMIRIGDKKKIKRSVFDTIEDAETYYDKLCRRRTEYKAIVVLADKLFVRKQYRIDKNWTGTRVLIDEDL